MKQLVLFASALLACNGADPRAPHVDIPADPSAADPAPPGQVEPQADALVGAYHEARGGPDALNLVVDADGTWRWHINGCDFRGYACGTWVRRGDGLELSALAGGKNQWIDEVGLVSMIGSFTAIEANGGLVVSGRVDGGEVRDLSQRWERGSVCAVCGGGLGPSGLQPCDKPPAKSICTER